MTSVEKGIHGRARPTSACDRGKEQLGLIDLVDRWKHAEDRRGDLSRKPTLKHGHRIQRAPFQIVWITTLQKLEQGFTVVSVLLRESEDCVTEGGIEDSCF